MAVILGGVNLFCLPIVDGQCLKCHVLPRIHSMRLTRVQKPLDDPDYIFELKHSRYISTVIALSCYTETRFAMTALQLFIFLPRLCILASNQRQTQWRSR
jgi:hypothetical protein